MIGMYTPPAPNQANQNNPALDAFKNKNNNFLGNNSGIVGMNMINQPNQGMLPNVNGINPNFNLNGNIGNNLMNNMQNMGFLNSNSLSNNLSYQQQQLKMGPNQMNNPGQAVNQFVFKQKEQPVPAPSQQVIK